MTSRARQTLGQTGERQAEDYLRRRGFRILVRHFRSPFGEIDIIARRRQVIHFCEVKTRRSMACGTPLEAVSFYKRRRLVKTALWYLGQRNDSEVDVRFSALGITIAEHQQPKIQWVEKAFDMDDI